MLQALSHLLHTTAQLHESITTSRVRVMGVAIVIVVVLLLKSQQIQFDRFHLSRGLIGMATDCSIHSESMIHHGLMETVWHVHLHPASLHLRLDRVAFGLFS